MHLKPRRSIAERREFGKSLRAQVPRSSHAEWPIEYARPDLITLIEEQNKDRLEFLLPVRHARMMESPFAFYRAGASMMAMDLASTRVTGLTVQACGDAHLANFGLYASPERKLVFDINDFDETLEGPWEWDLKRLMTSVTIAARYNQLNRDEARRATLRVAQTYREAMKDFAMMGATEVWYALIDENDYLSYADFKTTEKRAKKTIAKAKTKDHHQALQRLTEEVDDTYRIKSQPPLLIPSRDLKQRADFESLICESYAAYLRSVAPDCRVLLENYRPVDFALKVVGVGSVGTRCWILLLEGRDRRDPLFLQIKQATDSVLEPHLKASSCGNHGRRIVEGQRFMQTATDIFLGWTHAPSTGHDFYWRQLRDWKGSVDVENLSFEDLNSYGRLCAWTLARAHARSGDPVAIAGYLGKSDAIDRALIDFAERYAEQNQRDYETFLAAVRSGRLEAATDGQ